MVKKLICLTSILFWDVFILLAFLMIDKKIKKKILRQCALVIESRDWTDFASKKIWTFYCPGENIFPFLGDFFWALNLSLINPDFVKRSLLLLIISFEHVAVPEGSVGNWICIISACEKTLWHTKESPHCTCQSE